MWTVKVTLIVFTLGVINCAVINILHVNDPNHEIAETAVTEAFKHFRDKADISITLVHGITIGKDNETLDKLCELTETLNPHMILDTTRFGKSSEGVKYFARLLQIPTVSASWGQKRDIREWRDLDPDRIKHLVQIMPPLDLIPEIIRTVVIKQNYHSGAVLYDTNYELIHKLKSLLLNLPIRHTIVQMGYQGLALEDQLKKFSSNQVETFYIIGSIENIKKVMDKAKYMLNLPKIWHFVTHESLNLTYSHPNFTFLHMRPVEDAKLDQFLLEKGLKTDRKLDALFYYDLAFNTFMAAKHFSPWNMAHLTCEDKVTLPRNIDLYGYLEKNWIASLPDYPMYMKGNGESKMKFQLELWGNHLDIYGELNELRSVGKWAAGVGEELELIYPRVMEEYTGRTLYNLSVVLQMPFVYPNSSASRNFSGFCVDLIDEISKIANIRYNLYLPEENTSDPTDYDPFERAITEVRSGRAYAGIGSIWITAKRSEYVKFSVPFYDSVGITIMMKIPQASTSLFKFIMVLDAEVWLSILGAYFFASLILWIFEKYSPYSFRNDGEFFAQEEEERKHFGSIECLWFCLNSLTPEGGGPAPGCISGRVVAGIWWLFGFVIIASYTANLAAFLTASSLEAPIESLNDLSKQYQIKYGPINRTLVMEYFQNMALVEQEFYKFWFDETVKKAGLPSWSPDLALYEYPLKMKFEKMWMYIRDVKMPQSLEEAVRWVRASRTTSEGFAFVGDATDIKYLAMTTCDLQMVGDEFSKKPYGLVVGFKDNNLKDNLDNAIITLMNERILERLEKKWWKYNPNIMKCDHMQSNGITIQNIFGVFIIIGVGIIVGLVIMWLDKLYNKFMARTKIIPVPIETEN